MLFEIEVLGLTRKVDVLHKICHTQEVSQGFDVIA